MKKNKVAAAVNSIIIIGSGNVATRLGLALKDAGYQILQVYSRKKSSASLLAKRIGAQAITDLKNLNKDAGIYIIAVNDDSIETIVKKIRLKSQIVLHTSGSVKMNVLKKVSGNIGVLYPLQTLSKEKKIDFRKVPVCIEGNNKACLLSIKYFAKSISNTVQEADSQQRKMIHLAAVFASNFSNHMYVLAHSILKKNKLKFDLLKPLILETAIKAQTVVPAKAQTGPAIRADKKTIKSHLQLLTDKKSRELYRAISESIGKTKTS